jgi:hypothetical protein
VAAVNSATAVPVDGATATARALTAAGRLAFGALAATLAAFLAWGAAPRHKSSRELALLRMTGLSAPRAVGQLLIERALGAVVVLVAAVLATVAVSRLIPGMADETPYLRPPLQRSFSASTLVVAAGVLVTYLLFVALWARRRLSVRHPYRVVDRDE